MQIAIERKQLLAELRKVARGAVKGKPTIPVLACVHIETGDAQLFLRCTDLDTCIEGTVEADVESPGVVVLPVKKLITVLAKMEGETVELADCKPSHVDITCGKSEFQFTWAMEAGDFPERHAEPDTDYSLPVDMLRRLIDRTAFAISTGDDARYSLNGALLEIDKGTARIVGTDGYRLVWAEEELDQGWETEGTTGTIVDGAALRELALLLKGLGASAQLEAVAFGITVSGWLMFRLPGPGNHVLWTRPLDGKFPSYEKIMPSSHKVEVIVNREELASVVKRVSGLAGGKIKGVALTLPPNDLGPGVVELEVSASDPETGTAREVMDVQRQDCEEERVEVRFNSTYLVQYLAAAEGDEVVWRFEDGVKQSVFEPVEADPAGSIHRYIIMPVRR